MVPIRERKQFIEATRTKLVLEISGREPELRMVPASAKAPRISCRHRREDVAGTLGRQGIRFPVAATF